MMEGDTTVTEAEFLLGLKGELSQRAFARVLKVSEGYISMLLHNKRRCSRSFITRLVRVFPARGGEIISFFFRL